MHNSGTCLRRVQDVDREAVAEEHHERVPCTDRLGVPQRELDEGVVVAGTPDEARPRRLTERHPEAQDRAGADKGLVEVLNGLDEVGLPNEDVQVVGLLNKDSRQLHVQILPARTAPLHRRRPETEQKGVAGPLPTARRGSKVTEWIPRSHRRPSCPPRTPSQTSRWPPELLVRSTRVHPNPAP